MFIFPFLWLTFTCNFFTKTIAWRDLLSNYIRIVVLCECSVTGFVSGMSAVTWCACLDQGLS